MKALKSFFGLALLCVLLFSTENATAAVGNPSNTKTDFRTAFANVKKEFSELKKETVKVYRKAVKKIRTETAATAAISSLLLLALIALASIGLGVLLNINFLVNLGGILILVAIVWFILQLVGLI